MVLGNLVKSFNVSDVSRQEPWQHASLSLPRPEFWSQWVNQSDGKRDHSEAQTLFVPSSFSA